jgi:phage tail-like protein
VTTLEEPTADAGSDPGPGSGALAELIVRPDRMTTPVVRSRHADPDDERPAPWLRRQLPTPLAQDPFLIDFLSIFEHVGHTVQQSVDSVEHHVDVTLAPPAMLRYLGGWLGLALDPGSDEERHRQLLHTVGPLLGWRGTRRGLEGLVEALTDGRVRVHDHGGVFTRSEQLPRQDPTITVEVDHLGDLTAADLHALAAEVPAGARVEIVVGRRSARP